MAVVKIGSERSERPPILGTTTGEFSAFQQTFPLLSLVIYLQKNSRAASRLPRLEWDLGTFAGISGGLVGDLVGVLTTF